jgi:hypothetical protein
MEGNFTLLTDGFGSNYRCPCGNDPQVICRDSFGFANRFGNGSFVKK